MSIVEHPAYVPDLVELIAGRRSALCQVGFALRVGTLSTSRKPGPWACTRDPTSNCSARIFLSQIWLAMKVNDTFVQYKKHVVTCLSSIGILKVETSFVSADRHAKSLNPYFRELICRFLMLTQHDVIRCNMLPMAQLIES